MGGKQAKARRPKRKAAPRRSKASPSRIPLTVYLRARDTAERWTRRPEVVAVGLGLREREGRLTSERCVVVTVRWKRSPERIKELRQLKLPDAIRVSFHGRTYQVPVDVRHGHGRTAGRTQGLVGRPVVRSTQTKRFKGTTGAIVRRGGTRFILMAGHVAPRVGATVQIDGSGQTVDGTVVEVRIDRHVDHALVVTDDALPTDAPKLPDGTRFAGIRPVSPNDLKEVVLFRKRNGVVKTVKIERTNQSVPFKMPGGTIRYRDVVLTDLESEDGDSGTMLYDRDRLAIGTLLGEFEGHSCFLACGSSFVEHDIALV